MHRKLALILFSLGAVAGFGSGFASLAHHHRCHREAFEQHVARLCTDAAKRGYFDDRAEPPRDPR